MEITGKRAFRALMELCWPYCIQSPTSESVGWNSEVSDYGYFARQGHHVLCGKLLSKLLMPLDTIRQIEWPDTPTVCPASNIEQIIEYFFVQFLEAFYLVPLGFRTVKPIELASKTIIAF